MSWWNTFFDEDYGALWLGGRSPDYLNATADYVIRELELTQGNRVFDQCCGQGDFALAIARKGYHVIGVDLAESYIQAAQEAARSESLPAQFQAADAYHFIPKELCDGAYNWYTSFGYSDQDAENQRMLACVFQALKPGAWFLLETFNPAFALRHYREATHMQRPWQGGLMHIIRTPMLDIKRGMFGSEWQYHFPDGTRKIRSGENRIYFPADIARMLIDAGFSDISFMADIDGHPLDEHAPRFIVKARKP